MLWPAHLTNVFFRLKITHSLGLRIVPFKVVDFFDTVEQVMISMASNIEVMNALSMALTCRGGLLTY